MIPPLRNRLRRLAGIGAALLLFALLLLPGAMVLSPARPAWAGPVSWQELPASAEGRQWWDSGSLRLSRQGHLTVLSRFQPTPPPVPAAAAPSSGATSQAPVGTNPASESSRQAPGTLYVMELDCDQALYRDLAVNGLPRWGSPWQPAGSDDLVRRLINEVCTAGANLRQATEGFRG